MAFRSEPFRDPGGEVGIDEEAHARATGYAATASSRASEAA